MKSSIVENVCITEQGTGNETVKEEAGEIVKEDK